MNSKEKRNYITKIKELPLIPENEEKEEAEREQESEGDKVDKTNNKIIVSNEVLSWRTKNPKNKTGSKTINSHEQNKQGHITIEDIDAMKRWFIENWKTAQVIPFEILTLETFLMTYFNYTYDEILNMNERKYKVVEMRYSSFLTSVANVVHHQLFIYENLRNFMRMCKRNFNNQGSYNAIIQSYIKETIVLRMGYLIDAELAMKLKNEGNVNVVSATNKTKFHTIIAWLKKQKFVFIPQEHRNKLNMDDTYDVFNDVNDLDTYLVGYNAFIYTDIKMSPIGISSDSRLGWFSALNNYVTTQPILTITPQIKNFENQPHLTTITYTTDKADYSVEVYMLVDWNFYNNYKNESGVVNITVNNDSIFVNLKEFSSNPNDISKFLQSLSISAVRLTGEKMQGSLNNVQIQIRRSVSKMGSFMSKIESSKNKYLHEVKKGLYKIAVIAGKASGKSSLIELVKNQLSKNIYVEDSDDYGKFVTYIMTKYGIADIDELNNTLSEEQILNDAIYFAELIATVGTNHPSYYDLVVKNLIANDIDNSKLESCTKLGYHFEYSSMLTKLYKKYVTQIRDLYYKLDSGKVLNQKMYENGILNYMSKSGMNVLLEFFHIFSCNYRRKPANIAIRYEPNFNSTIAIYQRIISKELDPVEAISDILLKMFYDQSVEYVTSVIGPAAFMSLFGLVPVLTCKDSLCFDFHTHSDVTELGTVPPSGVLENKGI